jgi:hypothetical protein
MIRHPSGGLTPADVSIIFQTFGSSIELLTAEVSQEWLSESI